MPIPTTIRIEPLDLQKNISIGISLPFNGPAGPFNKTYSTKDQTKSNLINLLLTNKGERLFNPEFGTNIRKTLFEGITDDTTETLKDIINSSINYFIPNVKVIDIIIDSDKDKNIINISIKYSLRISGVEDQIKVQII